MPRIAASSAALTFCSRISLRTAGERLRGSSDSPPLIGARAGASATATGAAGATVRTGAAVAAAPALAAAGAAAAIAAVPAPPESRPISVPTSTVVPSGTTIASSTPSAGDGISTLILSVWISTSGSSLRTRSPTCFSHFETVPSATLSPSCGTTIEMGMWIPP